MGAINYAWDGAKIAVDYAWKGAKTGLKILTLTTLALGLANCSYSKEQRNVLELQFYFFTNGNPNIHRNGVTSDEE